MLFHKFFNEGGYTRVNDALARAIGIEEAYMLAYLCKRYEFFEERKELDSDGGFYATASDVQKSTGVGSRPQDRIFSSLGKHGILSLKVRTNKQGAPCRFFYFSEKADDIVLKHMGVTIDKAFHQNAKSISPKRKKHFTKTQKAFCKTVKTYKSKSRRKYRLKNYLPEEEGCAQKNKNEKNAKPSECVEALEVVEESAPQPDPRSWQDAPQAAPPQQKQPAQQSPPIFDISAGAKIERAMRALESAIDLSGGEMSAWQVDARRFVNGLLMNYRQGLQQFFAATDPKLTASFDSEELFAAIGDFYAMKVQKILQGVTSMARHKPEVIALRNLLCQAASRNYPVEFWLSRVMRAIQANAEWMHPFGVETYWDTEHQQWQRSKAAAHGTQGIPNQSQQSPNRPLTKSQEGYLRTQQILANNARKSMVASLTKKIKAGNHSEADYCAEPDLYEQICRDVNIVCPFDRNTAQASSEFF